MLRNWPRNTHYLTNHPWLSLLILTCTCNTAQTQKGNLHLLFLVFCKGIEELCFKIIRGLHHTRGHSAKKNPLILLPRILMLYLLRVVLILDVYNLIVSLALSKCRCKLSLLEDAILGPVVSKAFCLNGG